MTKERREKQLQFRCMALSMGLLLVGFIPALVAPTQPVPETETEIIRWKEEVETEETVGVTVADIDKVVVTEPAEPKNEGYEVYVETICKEYGVCPEVVLALIEAESSGNPNEISDHGAIGLMQVIPKWHWDRMEKLGVTDLYDPYSNILVGVDFLAELFDKYHELPIVLMCYNEGEYHGAPERAMNGNISDYANKIMKRASELQEKTDEEM